MRSPLRARQIAKTRRLVRNALSANMSPAATFFADKLVTLSGHEPEDVLLLARAYHSTGDYPRWIDTSTMIADPLTKAMSCERLEHTLKTGQLDLQPTAESLMIKEKNRKARKAVKEAAKTEKDPE